MSEISFIEKEPWFDPSPFIGNCYMYPNYMVKDGAEYFMFNRRVPDESWRERENAERRAQLLSNDGAFFALYGYKSDAFNIGLSEKDFSIKTVQNSKIQIKTLLVLPHRQMSCTLSKLSHK